MSQQSHPYRTNRDLFSNHYLTEHLRQTEPWKEVGEDEVREAYDEINELWEDKQDRVEDYNEAQLERNFIRPVFKILGIPFEIEETVMRNARRPDYGFFPSADAADAAFDRDDFYEEAIAVADAKRWGRKLDTRGEEKRDFENPSYQIHAYLQETPPQWAVLTNGKQWRIYYGPTSHRLDSYYEIDLPELFEFVEGEGGIEDFKDFYLFFRQQAFLSDRSGDCFLDDVYDESSVFAEAIGEDLQNNIYEAIRVLAEGFLDTNDDLDEDDLPLVHDSSLIYLYRLIFVLYAESEGRDLLPTDNDIYSESYSLNELKQTVADNRDETQQHYQTFQTHLWDRLEELFVLIDQGSQGKDIPKDQLYIPAYNGGLFRTNPDPDDSAEAQFLANHEADDAHLAEVIDLLTRRDADEGDGQVFVDYSSLDERHLGSIYEGLLEYKLDVADEPLTVDDGEYSPAGDGDEIKVEEGDVYLRTDAGERKDTGSYYTPEYIVEYIVDETLGPLVDDIREDLVGSESYHDGGFAGEFADQVFDLKVLDPAMGSGHFLVNAVDFLARQIIDAQERQDQQAVKRGDEDAISDPRTDEGELRDINWARRKVVQQCIYGVDLNPLATELAKVSLWLRTLAAEQPLAFLDHHLKTGNSLVGSDIEDVLSNGDDGDQSGQTQLTDWMDQARQRAIEHVMERFTDLLSIDNETLDDIKEMEEVYQEVRRDPLYQHLLAMANVHTASEFGLDVPEDSEEQMAEALRDDSWAEIEDKDWFRSAQAMSKEEKFFHWELEFPVAFYGDDGTRLNDAGFDAIIGNPPYVESERMVETVPELREYLAAVWDTTRGNWDLYIPFVEFSVKFSTGESSMIVPNKWLSIGYGEQLRELVTPDLTTLADFSHSGVFENVGIFPVVYFCKNQDTNENLVIESYDADYQITYSDEISRDVIDELPHLGALLSPHLDLTKKMLTTNMAFSDFLDCEEPFTVSEAYELKEYVREKSSSEEEVFKLVTTGAIDRYDILWGDEEIRYLGDVYEQPVVSAQDLQREFPRRYQQTSTEKILMSGIRNFEAALDYDCEFLSAKSTVIVEDFSDDFPMHLIGSILNSSLMWFYVKNVYSPLAMDEGINFTAPLVRDLPLPEISVTNEDDGILYELGNVAVSDVVVEQIKTYTQELEQYLRRKRHLNLSLLDYLGNYTEGLTLPDVGLFQPTPQNILNATTEDYEKLQVENVRTSREGHSVTIEVTARYKPENEDEFETDTWGYTETDYFEAFTLADLADEEAALIEAFVPVAVEDEIGGFSDNATKTISLIDRLKDITLPDIDDVQDDLQRYIETKERADELDEKIEKTDQRIDEIVYDLYDLTDEEIAIVEDTVNDD